MEQLSRQNSPAFDILDKIASPCRLPIKKNYIKIATYGTTNRPRDIQTRQEYNEKNFFKRTALRTDTSTLTIGVLQLIGQPIETFVETVSAGGARGLDVPIAVAQRMQTELVGDFGRVHGVRQVLLVGEYQKYGVPELVFGEHAHELVFGLGDTLPIVAVHYEDQALQIGFFFVRSLLLTKIKLFLRVSSGKN